MWKPSKRGSGGSPGLSLGQKGQKLFAFWIIRGTRSRHGAGAKMTPKRSLGSRETDRPALIASTRWPLRSRCAAIIPVSTRLLVRRSGSCPHRSRTPSGGLDSRLQELDRVHLIVGEAKSAEQIRPVI